MRAIVIPEYFNVPVGQILKETGKVFVVDRTVAVYIKHRLVYLDFPIGKVLEKARQVFVVDRAVVIDIARYKRRCAGEVAVCLHDGRENRQGYNYTQR